MFHHSEIGTQFLEEIICTRGALLGEYWSLLDSAGSYRRYWRLVRNTTDYWKLLENTGECWRLLEMLETTEDKKVERSWCWKWSLPGLGNNSIILQYCNNLRWQYIAIVTVFSA